MRRIIELTHRMDDYVCMWNGVEDLYIQETGEILPPKFFFVLSSFGSFCYQKTPKADIKRMVALGDGRTRKMYEFLAPIVGFDYKTYEYKSFKGALEKIKSEIDAGFPCMIGALGILGDYFCLRSYLTLHIILQAEYRLFLMGYSIKQESCGHLRGQLY